METGTRSYRLLFIAEDPIVRTGFRLGLAEFSDLEVVAETAEGAIALDRLDQAARAGTAIDVVIIDLSAGSTPADTHGLTICQQIKTQYPAQPVLLLSPFSEPIMVAAARRVGANGYVAKTLSVRALAAAIRRIAVGQSIWPAISSSSPPVSPLSRAPSLPPFSRLRFYLRRSGLRQIDAALSELTDELQTHDLSLIDRAILAGRHRELRAAHWVVSRLLATPALPDSGEAALAQDREPTIPASPVALTLLPPEPPPTLTQAPPQTLTQAGTANLQALLIDTIAAKLPMGLDNQTESPLEIDLLQNDKKQELLFLILRKFEDLLAELRFSQVQPDQLFTKCQPSTQGASLLRDLWQATVIDFFGKYYTVHLGGQPVEVVDRLLQDREPVAQEILDPIPGLPELLSHLLFQTPLVVDGVAYAVGNPAAIARATVLLENMMIQVANGVVQPLLNHFATVESIKSLFYDRRLLSSREIERLRNNLSWKYRLRKYVQEPQAMFESRYTLLVLTGRGIRQTSIYAPRHQELQDLRGIQLVVTLTLETRDAIAPRLQSAVTFLGNGLVYVLTDVIGRGLGLIGRGVLKGIGNAWQDSRFK